MAEILPIRRKSLSNQSINQSISSRQSLCSTTDVMDAVRVDSPSSESIVWASVVKTRTCLRIFLGIPGRGELKRC